MAIPAFLHSEGRLLALIFVEVESGRSASRPELAKTIARCRAAGAKSLVELDGLSRAAHFPLGLVRDGVDSLAVEMPHAYRLAIGSMVQGHPRAARRFAAP